MSSSTVSVWPGCMEFHQIVAGAVEVLQRGGLVVYPTDTLYGLGAHAYMPGAVERVFALKGRDAEKALPLLMARAEDMESVAAQVPAVAWRLASEFWPGALTLVLKRGPHVPDIVTGGGDTVAVRVPHHAVPLAVVAGLWAPIVGTSANRSGQPAPRRVEDLSDALREGVDLILDGGPCPGDTGSTVLDLTATPARILRAGAVTAEELRAIVDIG
jgi:L-threonylcarbamoyladenylate synthase